MRMIRPSRPNLPAARNAGVRAATGEIVIFVDDDVIIEPDFISGNVRALENDSVGGVTGLTLRPDERDNEQVRETQLSLLGCKERFPDGTASVYWTSGCCSSFRTSAIVEAGMSDERFTGGAWSEDADLSVRVASLGYKLIFDPRIRLIHLALPSGGCENRTDGHASEKKAEEQCRLYLFFCLKNRRIFGLARTMRAVWQAYRQYSLNRSLIQSWRTACGRQLLFARSVIGALRLIRSPKVETH